MYKILDEKSLADTHKYIQEFMAHADEIYKNRGVEHPLSTKAQVESALSMTEDFAVQIKTYLGKPCECEICKLRVEQVAKYQPKMDALVREWKSDMVETVPPQFF